MEAGTIEKPEPLRQVGHKKFSDAIITEIRALRNERDAEGKTVWTHAALAENFGTQAGTISQIVRNRVYKDENYVARNDKLKS